MAPGHCSSMREHAAGPDAGPDGRFSVCCARIGGSRRRVGAVGVARQGRLPIEVDWFPVPRPCELRQAHPWLAHEASDTSAGAVAVSGAMGGDALARAPRAAAHLRQQGRRAGTNAAAVGAGDAPVRPSGASSRAGHDAAVATWDRCRRCSCRRAVRTERSFGLTIMRRTVPHPRAPARRPIAGPTVSP